MPDVAMCLNPSCPSRHTCYRHEATPGEFHQSYGAFKVEVGAERCDSYAAVAKLDNEGEWMLRVWVYLVFGHCAFSTPCHLSAGLYWWAFSDIAVMFLYAAWAAEISATRAVRRLHGGE